MLATLADQPFSREGWLFEPKLDGERCLVFRHPTTLELYSRNRKLLNSKYPELIDPFGTQQSASFIMDGEIVTFESGVTSFAKLQQRMQMPHPSDELRSRVPVWFYAFDLLYLNGYDLRQIALRYRKRLLQTTFRFDGPLRLIEYRDTDGEAYYHEACERRWEGIIAKNSESAYVSARSRDWLKFKCVNEQEFVILGFTDPEGQRVGFGALLVGYYELCYAGKVGTGYNTLTLHRLRERLASLETASTPLEGGGLPRSGVHW
jgi:bifunctional non-homologous end joining protein LigD